MRASLVTSAKGFQGRSFLALSGLAPPPLPPGAAAGAGWITRMVQAAATTASETRKARRIGRTPQGRSNAYSSSATTPQPGPETGALAACVFRLATGWGVAGGGRGCPKHKRPIILGVYLATF